VLALLVGVASRIAIAAPQAGIAELRAVICCVEHCPKDAPRPPMTPRRCCAIDGGAGDPASVSPLASLAPPATVPVAVLAPAVEPPAVALVAPVAGARLRAGPPPYLRTLQIRC
jgi:hypothetical protein